MSLFILPDYPHMAIDVVQGDEVPIRVMLRALTPSAACPRCGTVGRRIHNQYTRALQDRPVGPHPVILVVTVRRFYCDAGSCSQKIFCERLAWAPAYQRRTTACTQHLLTLAWQMSAAATQRVAQGEGIRISIPTINRQLIRTASETTLPSQPLTVVGIDDWAWKKGHRYGTLVVDLSTHRPVAVLADRSAHTVASWLRQHPTIEIISRDRGGNYARGSRMGAPQAQQVADRFHLLKNWGDHVTAIIGPWSPPNRSESCSSGQASPSREEPLGERLSPAVSPQKQARWAAVHQLYDQGWSITAIAEETHCDPKTVRKDVAAQAPRVPAIRPPRRKPANQLLGKLWNGQRTSAHALWVAACEQGYTQSESTVRRWLRQRRGHVNRSQRREKLTPGSKTSHRPSRKPWAGRQWAHFLGTSWRHLPRRATDALSDRLAHDPLYRQAWTLTRHFQTLVRYRRGEAALTAWCRLAEASQIPAFVRFARTLREDWAAVTAGVTVQWSQGPVEGLNTRTKLLKRLMYGRAGLPLLSARILHH